MSTKLIDNILPEEEFTKLRDEVMSPQFPWFFSRNPPPNVQRENFFLNGWGNPILIRGKILYDPNDTLLTAAKKVLLNAGEELEELLRVRLILNTTSDKAYINGSHVDISYEHRTALLYFNDSDGDTIVYNEKFDPDYGPDTHAFYKEKISGHTILTQSSPKANRLFCFDGLHFHTGTTPTTVSRRVAMNINYLTKGMKKL